MDFPSTRILLRLSILNLSLNLSTPLNDLYPGRDSWLHPECLVGRMRVSGLLGCLSSEINTFAPLPQLGGAEVDKDHTKHDSPLPA